MGAATVVITSGYDLPKNIVGILADCGYSNQKDIIKVCIKKMKLSPTIFYPFVKLGAKVFGHFNLEEVTPIEEIKKSKIPTIFFHGDADEFGQKLALMGALTLYLDFINLFLFLLRIFGDRRS